MIKQKSNLEVFFEILFTLKGILPSNMNKSIDRNGYSTQTSDFFTATTPKCNHLRMVMAMHPYLASVYLLQNVNSCDIMLRITI